MGWLFAEKVGANGWISVPNGTRKSTKLAKSQQEPDSLQIGRDAQKGVRSQALDS